MIELRECYTPGRGDRETWGLNRNLLLNEGYGACNTGYGRGWVCQLGGIGCNVDHAAIRFAFAEAVAGIEQHSGDELARLKAALATVRRAAS